MSSPRRRWALGGAGLAIVLVVVAVVMFSGSSTTHPARAGAREHVTALTLTSLEGTPISLPATRPGALFFSGCVSCAVSAHGELKSRLGARADAVFISIDPNDPPSALRQLRSAQTSRAR